MAEDEEEKDEDPKEDIERLKRVKQNFKNFLSQNAKDLMSPAEYEKFTKVISRRLHAEGLPASLGNLKAFSSGFDFGVVSHESLGAAVAPMHASLQRLIDEKEHTIDITKSKKAE